MILGSIRKEFNLATYILYHSIPVSFMYRIDLCKVNYDIIRIDCYDSYVMIVDNSLAAIEKIRKSYCVWISTWDDIIISKDSKRIPVKLKKLIK